MTENWIQFGIGAAIIVAPWTLGFANIPLAKWTDMLAGLAIMLMNLWIIYGKGPEPGIEAAPAALAVAEELRVRPEVHRPKRMPRTATVRSKKVEKVLTNS